MFFPDEFLRMIRLTEPCGLFEAARWRPSGPRVNVGILKKSILVFAFLFSGFLSYPQNAVELIQKCLSANAKIQNGVYTATAGVKFITRQDTSFINGQVRFEKSIRDTALGYLFDITTGNERYLYDGRILTSAYLKDSLKIIHDRWIYPLDMKGKMQFRLISDYWTGKTIFLKEILDNRSAKKDLAKDTLIGNTDCFVIHIRPPDIQNAENQLQRLFISKNDFFLMGQTLSYEYLNKTHYQFLFVQDLEMNLARPDKNFSHDKLPKSFFTKRYVPDDIERLLPAGSYMPPFTLTDLEGKSFYSGEASGKIIVLYFWHMLSPESRNFLSVIERLSKDHEGMGVVFLGMNVKEPDPEGMKKILKRRNITFRQLLNARVTAMKYNVNDYPAFYVIGRNGKVIESFYDLKNAESRITLAIKRNLN